MKLPVLAIALVSFAFPFAAAAGPSWDSIRAQAYGDRPILDGTGVLTIEAPGRPEDLRAVPVSIAARFTDGRTIKTATLIVDENPSPVAAAFKLGANRDQVWLGTHIRLNAQSDVRAVVEASDGQLYMAARLVKFAGGQAACSAPPAGNPDEIAARMGRIELAEHTTGVAHSPALSRARLTLNHPNHTGMVLDQITLLYTPLLIVTDVAVRHDGDLLFDMTGSMTLSQNPTVDFDFKNSGAGALDIVMRDSSGQSWSANLPVGGGS